jgi:hypothetical protein
LDGLHTKRPGTLNMRQKVIDEQALARFTAGMNRAVLKKFRGRFASADIVRENCVIEGAKELGKLPPNLVGVERGRVTADQEPVSFLQDRQQGLDFVIGSEDPTVSALKLGIVTAQFQLGSDASDDLGGGQSARFIIVFKSAGKEPGMQDQFRYIRERRKLAANQPVIEEGQNVAKVENDCPNHVLTYNPVFP